MKRGVVALSALIAAGGVLLAGPLDPPAGPVVGTYKTLNEVEPRIAINAANTPGDADSVYRIAVRGSYYLTGNLVGAAAKHGIEIAATGVTVDLCGFDLQGVAGSLDGVSVTAASTNSVAVLNGSIRSWGGNGVNTASPAAINCRLVNLRVYGCSGHGIAAGPGTEVTHCTVTQNTLNGINTSICATITGCTAYANDGIGIFANNGSVIADCTSNSNTSNGISAAQGSTISRCASVGNGGDGLTAITAGSIVECTALSNSGDGISVGTSCLVRANTCRSNGSGAADGAAIHVTGSDNRIEGNIANTSDRGIDVDAAGNFITRNTCSGNTSNWELIAGNVCLVVNATLAPVISGNAGGLAPGSTDPNANFSY